MSNEENEPTTSMQDRIKKVFTNKKVRFGLAIATTAVVTAVISRSELFATDLDVEVTES
ncbi:hypothetical protein KC887_02280 [Candidatus Kaiserbacteria bacterium]|nr:hypothetical protein [Candidatus Kaiserbacteria bacterium]